MMPNFKLNPNKDENIDDADVLNTLGQGAASLSPDNLDKVSKSRANTESSTPEDEYTSAAKEDLLNSRTQGITKDQLDALHKHEAANTWTSLFMNMIGAANGIKDTARYSDPLNRQVEQERQGLNMQQQLANQAGERAAQEQKMGLIGKESAEKQRQIGLVQQPANKVQQGIATGLATKFGLPTDDIQNLTQETYGSTYKPLLDMLNAGIREDQIKAMLQKADKPQLKLDPSGNYIPVNPYVGTSFGKQQPTPEQKENPLTYNDVSSGKAQNILTPQEQKGATKQISSLQNDYQKNYGNAHNSFEDAYDKVSQLLDESQKGNYKAANSLALQMPKIIGGLQGQRITNQEINIENDPSSSGIYQTMLRKAQSLSGEGKVTPQDALFIKESMDGLRGQHDKMMKNVQDQYRTKAQSSLGNHKFSDDPYLFGSENKAPVENQSNAVGGLKSYKSLDDYINQKGQ